MVEKIPNPVWNMEKMEVIAASSKDKRVKNCIVIKAGLVPTILEIVCAAEKYGAIIENEPDQYLVQFPGEGQKLLTYSEIFKRLENSPSEKS